MKNMKFSESNRNINGNDTSKLREDLNSLMIIKMIKNMEMAFIVGKMVMNIKVIL